MIYVPLVWLFLVQIQVYNFTSFISLQISNNFIEKTWLDKDVYAMDNVYICNHAILGHNNSYYDLQIHDFPFCLHQFSTDIQV